MTRFLLDTHLLIWALGDPCRLSDSARQAIQSRENTVLFSAASIWEIAIKLQLGRADFAVKPDEIAQAALTTGFVELPIGWRTAAVVNELPMHHRDPFDRLLIAQAITEQVPLYSADRKLSAYSNLVTLV